MTHGSNTLSIGLPMGMSGRSSKDCDLMTRSAGQQKRVLLWEKHV